MLDTANKSVFRGMWNRIGQQDQSEDFDVFFQNYTDTWFDDFMEFFSMCVENREHFQYPDHIFQDIEPTESSIRKEYLNEILHPGLNTILWNLAWFHAELCKEKLKQTEKSV